MLTIDKDTKAITMVAKDTGDFVLSLDNYLLADGDTVKFTVNTAVQLEKPIFQKVITEFPANKAIIHLSSADTDLAPGTYLYDIQVDAADGRVDTVVGPAKFKITGGVTF